MLKSGNQKPNMTSQVSMDTFPISTDGMSRTIPLSYLQSQISQDAMAGPEEGHSQTNEQKAQDRSHGRSLTQSQQPIVQPSQRGSVQPSQSENNMVQSRLSGKVQYSENLRMIPQRSTSELEKVNSSLKNRDIGKGDEDDSSYNSFGSGRAESIGSLPSLDWEEELNLYKDQMPPKLKVGYIDVMVLYSEEDRPRAEEFCEHLKKEIPIESGPMEVLLYDAPELQALCGSKIKHLEKGVERSTYVFIFMTKNFVEDKWCEFSSESCLMEAITNPAKQWCVVPVYTEKRNASFRVPMGLNTLKGINYYNNDKFYRAGVARLIGDKIYVRKQLNEDLKMKQKVWLERYKRDQMTLSEQQRLLALREEALTNQLKDWLQSETARLIEQGNLPSGMHYSASESNLSGRSTINRSVSTGSLKPAGPQDPNVTAYFRELLQQQCVYGHNSENYTPEQLNYVQQFLGNDNSPPAMCPYPSRPQCNTRQLPMTSASYEKSPQGGNSSSPGPSADMGPATVPIVLDDGTEVEVSVPPELQEKIKGCSKDEQNYVLKAYYNELMSQQKRTGQLHRNFSSAYGQNRISQQIQQGMPNLSILHSQCLSEPLNYGSGNTVSNTNSFMRSERTSIQGSTMSTPSNNYDGNQSRSPGNMPNSSLLNFEPDGGSMQSRGQQSIGLQSSEPHSRGPQSREPESFDQTQAKEEKKDKKAQKSDDETSSDEEAEVTVKKKGKRKKIIKKVTYVINAENVQFGDHNKVYQKDNNGESSDASSDGVCETNPGQKHTDDIEQLESKDTGPQAESKKLVTELKPGTLTHGEMPEAQEPPAASNGSYNMDAALSTNQTGLSTLPASVQHESPQVLLKKKQSPTKGDVKNSAEHKVELAKEVLPEDGDEENLASSQNSTKSKENPKDQKQKVDESQFEKSTKSAFEDSVNINSSDSSIEKSSSLRKNIPFGNSETKIRAPQAAVKPMRQESSPQKKIPVAAVSPVQQQREDSCNENCDSTDPKTLIRSEQTMVKVKVSLHGTAAVGDRDQTTRKEAWVDSTRDAGNTTEPVNSAVVFPHPNAPISASSKRSDFQFGYRRQTDATALFYHNTFPPMDENGNDELSMPEQGATGDDLSRRTDNDTEHFMPGSAPFETQLSEAQEFCIVRSESCDPSISQSQFEESGTKNKSSGSWESKGKPSKDQPPKGAKDCSIS